MNRNTQKSPIYRTEKQTTRSTVHCDDWDTDPDFIHDIDEMEQRWGPKRTVGSINMNELINEVRRDHEKMKEKFKHPSQRDHSEGFGGKFGVQKDRMDPSAQDYDYQEELSKHTSQEISRKVIKSNTSTSSLGGSNTDVSDIRRKFFEKEESSSSNINPNETRPMRTYQTYTATTKKPSLPTKSADLINSRFQRPSSSNSGGGGSSSGYTSYVRSESKSPDGRPVETKEVKKQFEKRTESSTYGSSVGGTVDPPRREPFDGAYKSIRDKIDAFKKEFEDIENKVAEKSDLSKVIKKTTNVEKSSNVQYVSRSDSGVDNDDESNMAKSSTRMQAKNTSTNQKDIPSANIKSLSEKFENLCRQDSDEFRRQTEARRREFFDKIENQVRETRKNLDGFDPIDEDLHDKSSIRLNQTSFARSSPSSKSSSTIGPSKTPTSNLDGPYSLGSPSSRPSSRLSSDYQSSSGGMRPKIYTRSETTKEEIVSKIVKENDKIVENETKRNVEHTSSCHGSSDEDDDFCLRSGGTSSQSLSNIRSLDRDMRRSPVGPMRTSPIDDLKRRVPIVEPELKGAGLMARTLYDYQKAEEDELSFDVDDLITNIEKVDPGWYKGTITHKNGVKREGLFPANYVRLLNDTSEH